MKMNLLDSKINQNKLVYATDWIFFLLTHTELESSSDEHPIHKP